MSSKRYLFWLLLIIAPSIGGAYETDQFSNRDQPIADSTSIMNYQVTRAIASTITNLHGPRDEMKVVNGIYYEIGGKHWVDKLERYAMSSGEVEKLDTPSHDSIYTGHPLYAPRKEARMIVPQGWIIWRWSYLENQQCSDWHRQTWPLSFPGAKILPPLGKNG